jgi:type IV pilus assembly protein PilM
MSVLSIDIGTAHCTVLEGDVKKGIIEVKKAITANLPPDDSTDGKALAPVAAFDVISDIIKGYAMKSKNAVATISINNMLIRDFILPNAKQAQLMGMVRYEMMQNYSAGSTDVIQFIKHSVPELDTKKDGPGGQPKKSEEQTGIRAVAVKREIIDSYHTLLRRLRLTPIAMDFHANAVEKLIGISTHFNKADIKGKSYMLIDFGTSGTLLHAVADGKVFVSRHIPLGTNDLDQFVSDKEFIKKEQAKEFRMTEMNLLHTEESGTIPYMQSARNFLFQWNDELQKVIRFFVARKGIAAMDGIYIYGAGSQIKGLTEYLTASAGAPASRFNEISKLVFLDAKDRAILHNCINAAGAMLRLK